MKSGIVSNGYLTTVTERLQDSRMLSGLGARAVSLVQKNIRDGDWTPNAPLTRAIKGGTPKPLMDEGHLVASIDYRVEGSTVIAGTNRPGSNVIHDGGTLKPVSTKFLAIPAGRATKTLMGVYGLTARACIEGMKNAGFTVFFRQSKGGQSGAVLYLAPKAKEGTEPEILFVLKTEVVIPARYFLRLPEESLAMLSRYLLGFAARMED